MFSTSGLITIHYIGLDVQPAHNKHKQAGTELGQAQLKLGLDFTLIFCTIKIGPAMVEIDPKI